MRQGGHNHTLLLSSSGCAVCHPCVYLTVRFGTKCVAGTDVCDLQSEDLASEQTRQRGDTAQGVLSRPTVNGHQSDDNYDKVLEARQGSPHSMDLKGKSGRR